MTIENKQSEIIDREAKENEGTELTKQTRNCGVGTTCKERGDSRTLYRRDYRGMNKREK